MSKRNVAIVLTATVWVVVTALCWVGYTGEDDLRYARYAYLFHRPPLLLWEFRLPAIALMRGSFLLFGPTEFAAALPSLLASLAILGSVAWLIEWPRRLTWQTQAAVLVATLIPIDVGFRSYPAAHQIAAGFLAAGTACLLKGGRTTKVVGSALLALAFMTHEISVFYIGLLCLACLVADFRTYLRPVAWCAGMVVVFVAAESLLYQQWLGDPLARFKASNDMANSDPVGVDTTVGISGIAFWLWPVKNLVLGKHFGVDLLLLSVCGVFAWRRFDRRQRLLFVTTFAVFLWLGYGTQVPWAYRPLYREYHLYNSLTVGIAALLPFAIGYAFEHRVRTAWALMTVALAVHVVSLAASGRWGAPVEVARALLQYADEHRDRTFLTDVGTMNDMYVLNGFHLPANVVCLNGGAMVTLLLNKEPDTTPRYVFPDRPISGVLVNREQRDVIGFQFEPEFPQYIAEHGAGTTTIADVQYRWPFRPFIGLVGARAFMIRNEGGELVTVRRGDKSEPAAATAPAAVTGHDAVASARH